MELRVFTSEVSRADAFVGRSNVRYKGGGVGFPDVPVQVTVSPSPGDQTAVIQAAIDQVSQLPPDENGFRGALLLQQGEYPIADHLETSTRGVVLRGEGDSTAHIDRSQDAAAGSRMSQ